MLVALALLVSAFVSATAMSSSNSNLVKVPIGKRPPISGERKIYAILFLISMALGFLLINGFQILFLLPLRLIPFPWAKDLYYAGIRYTKSAFGCLIILMCQWFAPTKLAITFETEGLGAFTKEEIDRYTVKDRNGKIVALDLPTRFVLIANHQIWADWWYQWCFTYFMSPQRVHRYVYITLKKSSVRWVPILGWLMQFFEFIFLARSWSSDRQQLAVSLASLGREAEQEGKPLSFILYPEGTLVTKDTRSRSKKFAEKLGIPNLTNIVLPRSKGLQYTLRSLVPRITGLRILDMTIAYPGIPRLGHSQSYYTLRSIFRDGNPPPTVHIHLRMFDVKSEVPIGDLFSASGAKTPKLDSKQMVDVDIPNEEKEVFSIWLRNLWTSKDADMDRYLDTKSFASRQHITPSMEIPVQLNSNWEILDAFCCFWPVVLAYLWGKMIPG